MRDIRGNPDGRACRVGMAVASYNESITRGLLDGALASLRQAGVADDAITVVHVPGALELPLAVQQLALHGGHDAVLALGAVIRGETDHYDYVCTETAAGCSRVALDTGVPVAFGVLTCETLAQAQARAGGAAKNKGVEAARAALEMIDVLGQVRKLSAARAPSGKASGAPTRAPSGDAP